MAIHPMTPDDAQVVDNVLVDVPMDGATRRAILGRAAAAAVAGSVLGRSGIAWAQGSGDSAKKILDTAITAEALAVTFLSGVIATVEDSKVTKFKKVLQAANQAEYDHYQVLGSLGAKPITKKFWAPDAAFKDVFGVLEVAETLFVNAYLIGVTAFAKAGQADNARYAGEILGVEAQHRTLVRFAQGKPPANVAFEKFDVDSIDGIVKGLTDLGIGFGKQGKGPGKFYEFPGKPPAGTTTNISTDKPS